MLRLLLLAGVAFAHYKLDTPAPIGSSPDTQTEGPCGGLTVDEASNTITDYYIAGHPIGLTNGHDESHFLYRGTLDLTGNSGWTALMPVVATVGEGQFCEPLVPAPAEWNGKRGLISVVGTGSKLLYSCALVTFVEGSFSGSDDKCTNSTGITAEYVNDRAIGAEVDNPDDITVAGASENQEGDALTEESGSASATSDVASSASDAASSATDAAASVTGNVAAPTAAVQWTGAAVAIVAAAAVALV